MLSCFLIGPFVSRNLLKGPPCFLAWCSIYILDFLWLRLIRRIFHRQNVVRKNFLVRELNVCINFFWFNNLIYYYFSTTWPWAFQNLNVLVTSLMINYLMIFFPALTIKQWIKGRVADPDPNFNKKPAPDLDVKKKPDPIQTLKNPDPDPT